MRQLCEEFALQPRRTNGNDADVCEPICINMYCRAKHDNHEKNYPFIQRRSEKNFRVINLFTGSIFAIKFYFALWYNSVHRNGSFVPPGWGANSSQKCHSCSFCSHKQRCWTVLSELRYEVASNLNTFFLGWNQRTAVNVVENALQYIKMYAAGVWAKTAKGYFKNAEEQFILLQSKVWSNL